MNRPGTILAIVVGLLWSSFCAVQCRIVPTAAKASSEHTPPCHQKKLPQQQTPKTVCGDASQFEAVEKAFQSAVAPPPPNQSPASPELIAVAKVSDASVAAPLFSPPPHFPIRV